MKLLSLITLVIVLLTSCSDQDYTLTVDSAKVQLVDYNQLIDIPVTLEQYRSHKAGDTIMYDNHQAVIKYYHLTKVKK